MEGNVFEVVVRRVAGAEWIAAQAYDLADAVNERRAVVAAYRRRGFVGGRNAAGTYRLSARVDGKRVRLAVTIRRVASAFSVN